MVDFPWLCWFLGVYLLSTSQFNTSQVCQSPPVVHQRTLRRTTRGHVRPPGGTSGLGAIPKPWKKNWGPLLSMSHPGSLIGILCMFLNNPPHDWAVSSPTNPLNNQLVFHCSIHFPYSKEDTCANKPPKKTSEYDPKKLPHLSQKKATNWESTTHNFALQKWIWNSIATCYFMCLNKINIHVFGAWDARCKHKQTTTRVWHMFLNLPAKLQKAVVKIEGFVSHMCLASQNLFS